eukprot:jgi/Botrbrau1/8915/Bobra.0148s0029.1
MSDGEEHGKRAADEENALEDEPDSKRIKTVSASTSAVVEAAGSAGCAGEQSEGSKGANTAEAMDANVGPADASTSKEQEEAAAMKVEAINPEAVKDLGKARVAPDAPETPAKNTGRKGVTIGYKTFKTGPEAAAYYHYLIENIRPNQDLNEYEFHNVIELVKMGHPNSDVKIRPGVKSIRIRTYTAEDGDESVCFYLLKDNGTEDNFSVRKCLATLFPDISAPKNFGNRRGEGKRFGRGGGRSPSRGRRGRAGGPGRGNKG